MSVGKLIIVSFVLIVLTTIVHSITTKYMLLYLKRHSGRKTKYWLPQSYWISVIVILLIVVCLFEATLWAYAYLLLGAFSSFEASVYFSLVSFTTLGYGDITLNENFRLLSAIEAANGIILFGWSTAIVVAVVQRIHFKNKSVNNE